MNYTSHPLSKEGTRSSTPKGFRMWSESVPANLEKLRTGVRTRSRLADVFLSSIRYLFQTEVHAYAFSIAANAYLSFFPFNLILLAVCQRWMHWESAYLMVLQLLRVHLPAGSESLIRNLVAVVQGRPRLQVVSVFMLLFTSSGVFLPLEIALNKVWGFQRNRTFLKNQGMSFGLALASGMLALIFVLAITPMQSAIAFSLGRVPFPSILTTVTRVVLEIASMPFMAVIYLLIYYYLPNGKVPIGRVLPAALATNLNGSRDDHLFPDAPHVSFPRGLRPFCAVRDLAFLGVCGRHDAALRRAPFRAWTYFARRHEGADRAEWK